LGELVEGFLTNSLCGKEAFGSWCSMYNWSLSDLDCNDWGYWRNWGSFLLGFSKFGVLVVLSFFVVFS
jgi:hypothetical protein